MFDEGNKKERLSFLVFLSESVQDIIEERW